MWMKSAVNSSRGTAPIDTIIVHHAGCNVGIVLSTFPSQKRPHSMIDTDGQIVKLCRDLRSAAHAGKSRWKGVIGMNPSSIGIEILNTTGVYPEAQYLALLGLLDRLTSNFSSVESWNIIGSQRHWNK